ncbi:hypothetical protein ISS21_01535 [Patescibacteria group bacterium]|nr:hypothetical protein [Patescibacteria group bacterium]
MPFEVLPKEQLEKREEGIDLNLVKEKAVVKKEDPIKKQIFAENDQRSQKILESHPDSDLRKLIFHNREITRRVIEDPQKISKQEGSE